MKKFLFVCLLLMFSSNISFAFSPHSACHYLDSQGLKTQGYKYDGMGEYFCITPYVFQDSKTNIAYNAIGEKANSYTLTLYLNYYNNSNKQLMHNALIKNAKVLSKKSINYELPNTIISNLINGKNGTWKTGKYTIEIYKDIWPSNKGYTLQFSIKE